MSQPALRASLLVQLVLRDFRQRYVGSLLGWLWGVVHPLVLLAVYTLLFRYAFNARLPPDESTGNYPLFLMAGLLPWLVFSETLTRSANTLAEHANLIKRSVFPSEALPMAVLASNLAFHLVSVAVLLVVATVWGHPPGMPALLLPLQAGLLALFALGLSWVVAGLQAYLRDTAQVLAVALVAWFWATPVFLPEAYYRGRFDALLDWNPLRYAVAGYRTAIVGSSPPPLADALVLAGFAGASALIGWLFFRRVKRGLADVL